MGNSPVLAGEILYSVEMHSSPGQGHHVVLLGMTLSSHSASLHRGVLMVISELDAAG